MNKAPILTAAQRASHWSARLDAWCKDVGQLEHDLKNNPDLNWLTERTPGFPLWMEMFCGKNAPLLHRLDDRHWSVWLSHRHHQIDQCQSLWAALSADDLKSNPIAPMKSLPPARGRTTLLCQSFSPLLAATCPKDDNGLGKNDVMSATVAALQTFVEQYEQTSSDPLINQAFGALFDALAHHHPQAPSAGLSASFWERRHHLLFQSPSNNFGLVSTVELSFLFWMKGCLTDDAKTQDWERFFWDACKARIRAFGIDDKDVALSRFVLPSFHVIKSSLNKMAQRHFDHADVFEANMDKIELCLDVGAWPWLTDTAPTKKKRM